MATERTQHIARRWAERLEGEREYELTVDDVASYCREAQVFPSDVRHWAHLEDTHTALLAALNAAVAALEQTISLNGPMTMNELRAVAKHGRNAIRLAEREQL